MTRYLERRTKMKKEKVVIVSGYFDPLHVGHLEYLQMASQLGDTLLVIINNDEQAKLKKIIDEGATVLSEVEDLSAVLKDTVKAVAEELEIKPALINKAIKIAHKGEWSKYSEAFDSLENLIIAVGKDK